MSGRTAAFGLGFVTFLAALVVANALVIVADETWPGHPSLTAFRELVTGAGGS